MYANAAATNTSTTAPRIYRALSVDKNQKNIPCTPMTAYMIAPAAFFLSIVRSTLGVSFDSCSLA